MKNKLIPQFNDSMPREVAINILSNPKARITNVFRKQCKRALENRFVAPPPPDNPNKNACKFHKYTLAQLLKWQTRCDARRAIAQSRYVALKSLEETQPLTKPQIQMLATLGMQASILDGVLDSIDEEIRLRVRVIRNLGRAEPNGFFRMQLPRVAREKIRLDTIQAA